MSRKPLVICAFKGVREVTELNLKVHDQANTVKTKEDVRFKYMFEGYASEHNQKCMTKVIAIKMSPDNFGHMVQDEDSAAVGYEAEVYKLVTQLADDGASPNFVRFVSSGQCTFDQIIKELQKLSKSPRSKESKTTLNIMSYFLSNGRDRAKLMGLAPFVAMKFLIPIAPVAQRMEMAQVLTTLVPKHFQGCLANLVKSMPPVALKGVLFQMLHTLWVCFENEIVHNDCHAGNWLVGRLDDTNERLAYRMDKDTVAVMPDNTVLYLYDWDRAYVKRLGPNPLLAEQEDYLCRKYGQCNALSNTHDVVMGLCEALHLLRMCDEKRLNFNFPVDRQFVKDALPMARICGSKDKHPCLLSHKELSKIHHMTVQELMWHPYFDSLRQPAKSLPADQKIWGNTVPNSHKTSIPVQSTERGVKRTRFTPTMPVQVADLGLPPMQELFAMSPIVEAMPSAIMPFPTMPIFEMPNLASEEELLESPAMQHGAPVEVIDISSTEKSAGRPLGGTVDLTGDSSPLPIHKRMRRMTGTVDLTRD